MKDFRILHFTKCTGLRFAAILSLLLTQQCWSADAQSQPLVRKPNPASDGEFLAVEPDQVIPGKIYNHFSARHGRYVWAFAQAGGGFSYTLGPGSTENPSNFDLATSERETKDILESEAGPWAKRSRRERSTIFVRLKPDNQWKVVRTRAIRSHYDIDSGQRWEWHGKRKVAVLNTGGNHWTYDGTRYRPGLAGPVVLGGLSGPCECVVAPHDLLY
ncbi:MAG: hypothetical protein ACR2NM_08475 [Bythopirellula sp.]